MILYGNDFQKMLFCIVVLRTKKVQRIIWSTLSFLIADAEGIGDSQGKFWVINKRHSGNKGHCELFGYYQLPTQCKSIADTVSKSPKY